MKEKKKFIVNDPFEIVVQWAVKILTSVLIVYLAHLVAQRTSKLIMSKIKNRGVPEHKRLIIHQLSQIASYAITVAGVLVALINLGVQTASIVTVMGTLMVTIGLALQTTLTNIFSGVGIGLSDNFRIGDKLRLYLPWIREPIIGRVEDMNITYVMLREEKTNKIIYIPNMTVSGNVFANMSRTQVAPPE